MSNVSIAHRNKWKDNATKMEGVILDSFTIKDYVEFENTFHYIGFDEKAKEDTYVMEQRHLFKALQDFKGLEDGVLDGGRDFDIMYNLFNVEDVRMLKSYLIKLPLYTNINWKDYVVYARIEMIEEICLDF